METSQEVQPTTYIYIHILKISSGNFRQNFAKKNNILQLLGGFIGLEQTLETQFTFCPKRIKKLKREKLVLPSELFQNYITFPLSTFLLKIFQISFEIPPIPPKFQVDLTLNFIFRQGLQRKWWRKCRKNAQMFGRCFPKLCLSSIPAYSDSLNSQHIQLG